jgi:hypothetical protein
MTESRITIRLRPFDKLLTAENNALQCSGRIEGDAYVLTIGAGVHRLPIVEANSDEWGSYALVEPSETQLQAGFVLRVEMNYEEPDFEVGISFDPGCRISLVRPPDLDPAMLGGFDPSMVNVITVPEASVSIYFSAAGAVDGYAMVAHPEDGPRSRPQ